MANTGNTQQIIDYGAAANDGTGDPLRTAFIKTDENFANIWAAGPVGSNITIANNTIQNDSTNGNIIVKPNGTGVVQVNAHVIPNIDGVRDLGSANLSWRRAYIDTVTTTDLDVSGDLTVQGNLTVEGDTIQIGNIVTDTLTIQLANTAGNKSAANGAGITVGANDAIATYLFNSTSNVWTTNIGVSATGNITAPYFSGNGSLLTGIVSSYSNANVQALGNSGWNGNIIPAANAVYSLGNATNYWANLWVANNTIYIGGVPLGMTSGNVLTVNGNAVLSNNSNTAISTTGNITANYFIGNGSLLTGISSTGSFVFANNQMSIANTVMDIRATGTGADIDIEAADAVFIEALAGEVDIRSADETFITTGSGGNIWTFGIDGSLTAPGNVSATGNVSGAYIKGNGSELTNLPAPTVTQDISSNGAMSIMTYDGVIKYVNYATVEPASGNITAGNVLTGGRVSATGNVTGGNILTGGLILATGNITGGNISTGVITLTNGATIRDTSGDAVAFGQNAGLTSQGNFAVGIGRNAGQTTQGGAAVAIGVSAGDTSQGNSAVAVGQSAGFTNQSANTVAVGVGAGQTSQGVDAVAVGASAGSLTQGIAAVAIGTLAGRTFQANNSIILNALVPTWIKPLPTHSQWHRLEMMWLTLVKLYSTMTHQKKSLMAIL